MLRFRDAWWTAFQAVSGLLIKRGTAIGPLVPLLWLVPVCLGFAWLFEAVLIIGVPLISLALVLAVLGIIFVYLRHYAWFAKHDPDRLQSEEYRYETARMQMIASKDLPQPIPEGSALLKESVENPAKPRSPDESENNSESAIGEEERES